MLVDTDTLTRETVQAKVAAFQGKTTIIDLTSPAVADKISQGITGGKFYQLNDLAGDSRGRVRGLKIGNKIIQILFSGLETNHQNCSEWVPDHKSEEDQWAQLAIWPGHQWLEVADDGSILCVVMPIGPRMVIFPPQPLQLPIT